MVVIMISIAYEASGAKTRQAPIFKKREKRIWSCATQNSHESRNFKNATTFESMELSQWILVLHVAQHLYNTLHTTLQSKCVYIITLRVVQTVHLLFVDIVCLHLTNMAENIMFLHNMMFWAWRRLAIFRTGRLIY